MQPGQKSLKTRQDIRSYPVVGVGEKVIFQFFETKIN